MTADRVDGRSSTYGYCNVSQYASGVSAPLDPDLFASCGSIRPPVQIGNKWDAQIIYCLLDGPRRFGEMAVPMKHVSPKVLTESLRALERDGFIVRTVHSEVPRHVSYELTPLGRSLIGPLQLVCDWSEQHLPEMVEARRRHEDARLA